MSSLSYVWDKPARDNVLAESFFATCKLELIEPATWPTRARARTATVHWLEAVYNRLRRHTAIDMPSPVNYEERYWEPVVAGVLEARRELLGLDHRECPGGFGMCGKERLHLRGSEFAGPGIGSHRDELVTERPREREPCPGMIGRRRFCRESHATLGEQPHAGSRSLPQTRGGCSMTVIRDLSRADEPVACCPGGGPAEMRHGKRVELAGAPQLWNNVTIVSRSHGARGATFLAMLGPSDPRPTERRRVTVRPKGREIDHAQCSHRSGDSCHRPGA